MISSKEISASLNENNESIIFDSEETTGLQNISASLIEKINTTILYNEKILVNNLYFLQYFIFFLGW